MMTRNLSDSGRKIVLAGASSVIGGSVIGALQALSRLLMAAADTDLAATGISAARASIVELEEEVLPLVGILVVVLIAAIVVFYFASRGSLKPTRKRRARKSSKPKPPQATPIEE